VSSSIGEAQLSTSLRDRISRLITGSRSMALSMGPLVIDLDTFRSNAKQIVQQPSADASAVQVSVNVILVPGVLASAHHGASTPRESNLLAIEAFLAAVAEAEKNGLRVVWLRFGARLGRLELPRVEVRLRRAMGAVVREPRRGIAYSACIVTRDRSPKRIGQPIWPAGVRSGEPVRGVVHGRPRSTRSGSGQRGGSEGEKS